MPGREKVDLFVDANLGGFGLLLVKQFGSVNIDDAFADAIKQVLGKFSFPVLNIVSSASGKLVKKDKNDLKVESWLEEMETRVTLKAFGSDGTQLQGQPGDVSKPLEVLGLLPSETKSSEPEEPPIQMAPNVSGILSAVGGGGPIRGVISALGLTLAPLFKPKPKILQKTFRASASEFGWYLRSDDQAQQEGVHYTAAVLQVSRDVDKLEVVVEQISDWKKGGVDNQKIPLTKTLKMSHPRVPTTPQLSDLSSPATIPIVVPREDVRKLLAITDEELEALISDGPLVAFGAGKKRITKGSLVSLLGLSPAKSDRDSRALAAKV